MKKFFKIRYQVDKLSLVEFLNNIDKYTPKINLTFL